ncbi:hypothetical protein F4678DRAFT_427954 [Xylaria arbuscula]|nr:hypothetical protein F4678DRAFT_427954 [Xylaria arbuscula]
MHQTTSDNKPASLGHPERLLRLSIAHYKNKSVSDEDFHKWATEEHCVRAAEIHAKHGIQMYDMMFTLQPARDALSKLNAKLGSNWVVDDHDVVVEFYLRNVSALVNILDDPEFQVLQAAEGPWVDSQRGGISASLGWVEFYIENGKPVNSSPGGKPTYERLNLSGINGLNL